MGARSDQLVTLMLDGPADDARLKSFLQDWRDGRAVRDNLGVLWQTALSLVLQQCACRRPDAEMNDSSPHSPEARRKRLRQAGAHLSRELKRPRPVTHPLEITKRVAVGVYTDGFIHAGNLAYLSLVTLFPFFIVATAAATLFWRRSEGMAGVSGFLSNVPPGVANSLRGPIAGEVTARTVNPPWYCGVGGRWTNGRALATNS